MTSHRGLRHLALGVTDVPQSIEFCTRALGARVLWEPDPKNVYLSSGCDNLAIHHGAHGQPRASALDHLGFIAPSIAEVKAGWDVVRVEGLDIVHPLRHHRDSSVSFCFPDPEGNLVQLLYESTISTLKLGSPKI